MGQCTQAPIANFKFQQSTQGILTHRLGQSKKNVSPVIVEYPIYEAGVTAIANTASSTKTENAKRPFRSSDCKSATVFLLDKIQDLVVLKRTSTGHQFVLSFYRLQASSSYGQGYLRGFVTGRILVLRSAYPRKSWLTPGLINITH